MNDVLNRLAKLNENIEQATTEQLLELANIAATELDKMVQENETLRELVEKYRKLNEQILQRREKLIETQNRIIDKQGGIIAMQGGKIELLNALLRKDDV